MKLIKLLLLLVFTLNAFSATKNISSENLKLGEPETTNKQVIFDFGLGANNPCIKSRLQCRFAKA